MRVHAWFRTLSATVVAAVLSAVTLPAGAQVTSEQRIPVRKESGGDVARRDSIARADAARRDSIAMLQAQNDSLMRANQAYRDSVNRALAAYRDSVARAVPVVLYDSVAAADSVRHAAALAAAATAAIPVAWSRRGFYFGLAGGTSSPNGDWATPYSLGFNITAPFGWQSYENRFGIRGDIAYDLHGGEYLPAGTVNQPVDYPQPVDFERPRSGPRHLVGQPRCDIRHPAVGRQEAWRALCAGRRRRALSSARARPTFLQPLISRRRRWRMSRQQSLAGTPVRECRSESVRLHSSSNRGGSRPISAQRTPRGLR